MPPGILLSNHWLGQDTRRHYLLDTVTQTARTVINIQQYPFTSDKAHIALISDVDLTHNTIITESHDNQNHEYVVAMVKKTPNTWWQAAGLFIVRQMAIRGRIKVIER